MEGKSILNRNISEIAQILDQECTKNFLRSLIQLFEGPLLLYLPKSANLCCEHVDQPLFCHSIPSQLAQFLLLQAPSQVWNPSPTWHKPKCATVASSLGLHCSFQCLPASSAQNSQQFLSWYMPTSCHWVDFFFPCFQKNRSGNISWMV